MSRRSVWTLSLVGLAIALAGLVAYGDQPIASLLYAGDGPWAGFFGRVTMVGSSVVYLVPLGLAAVLLLVAASHAARRTRAARLRLAGCLMFVFAAIALSGLTVDLIKVLVGRARPYLWRDGGIYQFAPPGLSSLYQSCAELMAKANRLDDAIKLLEKGIGIPGMTNVFQLYQTEIEFLGKAADYARVDCLIERGLTTIPKGDNRYKIAETALRLFSEQGDAERIQKLRDATDCLQLDAP